MENDLILSLETATRGGSLALMRGSSILSSSTGIAEESHSVSLLRSIEALLNESHVKLRDVELFATAAGPGSFTGLRIGLATMKAFAATFDRPCIGVPTLEAIAFAAGSSNCTYALLAAGRGEVFAQTFIRGSEARNAEHIPPSVLLDNITEPCQILWAGPGAHLYKELIHQRATALGVEFVEEPIETRNAAAIGSDLLWTLAPNIEQLAEYVALLALGRVKDSEKYRAEDLRAIYVRPSDAELHK